MVGGSSDRLCLGHVCYCLCGWVECTARPINPDYKEEEEVAFNLEVGGLVVWLVCLGVGA